MAHHTTIPQLASRFQQADKPQSLIPGMLKACALIAKAGVDQGFREQRAPDGTPWKKIHSRPDGSSQILQDQGRLWRSIKCLVQEGKLVLQASHPGAALHQFGGTITPRSAKRLAIPLTVEAKRKGSPRRMRGLFYFLSKRGNEFLARSENGQLVLQYLLKDKVKVDKREFLGYSERTIEKIQRFIADRLATAVAGPFGGV